MARVVWATLVFAVFVLAQTRAIAQCTNIAGNWYATETGTITIALIASDGESDTETDPVSGSGTVTITQTGACTFQYNPLQVTGSSLVNSGLTPAQLATLVRTVQVSGNSVTETGIFAILNTAAAGLTVSSVTGNVETGTGQVTTANSPVMTMNGSADMVVTGSLSSGGQTYTFTLTVTASTTATFSGITITPPDQTSVASGLAYNGRFTATGGSGTGYTWCVLSGVAGTACLPSNDVVPPLPAGFSLVHNSGNTALLKSTGNPPATEGSYPFTVQVTDSGGTSATQLFTLNIGCPVIMSRDALGKYMFATFTPPPIVDNPNPTLFEYAPTCNFATFNWQQEWTALPIGSALTPVLPSVLPDNVYPASCSGIDSPQWPDSCYLVAGPASLTGDALNYPDFNDPPQGGYVNTNAPPGYNPYPFYYPSDEIQPDVAVCTMPAQNGVAQCPPFQFIVSNNNSALSFLDDPAIKFLPGDDPSPSPTPGHFVAFSTALVGVDSQNQPHTLYSWTWNSTFNGTAGGTSQSVSFSPIDPGSGSGGITVTSVNGVPTPTVTVTPSAISITTAQGVTATVSVNGASGTPTATGTITLTSGSYTSVTTILSNGAATISIPAGSLASGSDTLTAVYTPDNVSAATFSISSGFAQVKVTLPVTVTVTPSSTSILSAQTLPVTIAVGGGSGNPTPTGTVTMSSGSYSSSIASLSGGTATITIPANSLSAGSDVLTADYTPDSSSSSTYDSASGLSPPVTVTLSPAAAAPVFSPAPGTYTTTQAVTISDTTPGATIYYTKNGATPTTSSAVYGGAISVSATETLQAIAVAPAYSPSAVASAGYIITSTFTGPGIESVSAILPQQTQTITITGAGFGTHAAYSGNSSYINFVDNSGVTWSAGTGADLVGLSVSSWTDTQIVLAGFTGDYGSFGWTLSSGDKISLSIWNVQTGAGPYACTNIIVGTGPTTCGTIPKTVTPTVTVTPASTSITTAQALTVTVAVSGGSSNPTPTGSVTLSSGSYANSQNLSSGSTAFTIPAGSLATGSDTLTARYTPDSNSSATYNSATGTSPQVTVTLAPAPSFTVSGTAVAVAPGATTGNTSTITVTPAGGFTGSVALAAAITSSPAEALHLPTLSFGSSSPVSIAGIAPETAILTISTMAPTSAALVSPKGSGVPWHVADGAALACILLFGISARRRRWHCTLGMLALLVTLASGILSCGGGSGGGGGAGNSGGGGGTSNPGTTAGTYTITVTGTSGATTVTGSVALTVQ